MLRSIPGHDNAKGINNHLLPFYILPKRHFMDCHFVLVLEIILVNMAIHYIPTQHQPNTRDA